MNSKWTWACGLGCAGMAGLATALAAADSAPADANPYSVISDRNIFHLNPPPPPPDPDAGKPPPEQRKLMLTGIIKKRDSIEVLLAIPPKDNKETMIYLSLAPGEKEHDVELVKVRYDKEEVDVINAGKSETLTVKSNSYLSAAPPAPHPGGAVPVLPGFGHRPGFPMRTLPTPPGPSAALEPRGGSAIVAGGGGGSAIVAGGGGAGNVGSPYSPYGESSRGALVSGGASYAPTGAAFGSNPGEQIARTLFNQPNGAQQFVPSPIVPSAPTPVQAAGMMVHEAAGGPPMPPLPP